MMWRLALLLGLGLSGWAWAQEGLELWPPPGQVVQEERPCIQVSWPKLQLLSGKCRLWVDGKEVTLDCLRSNGFLSYRPYRPFKEGPVEVRFVAEGTAAPREAGWHFRVVPLKVVSNFGHNAQGDLLEDDELEVQFQAPSGGKAAFQLSSFPPVVMAEPKPGQYVGRYRVRVQDCDLKAKLVASFSQGDHREELVCPAPIKVFGGLYRVKVLEPKDGSLVEQNFLLRGRARPGSRVTVIPRVGFNQVVAPTTDSAAVASTAGSIPAEVDEQGNFQVEYGIPILLPGMQVVLTIFSVEADGSRSMPTVVHYRFR